MKGEFENRLRQVIDEVQSSPKPIILFIDEAHTLIGAGGAAGTGDAANLLKPALARGTLRTIAATTWAEYKKYIEKDPALTRRFQVVQVDEPSEDKAMLMLRGVASVLEAAPSRAGARRSARGGGAAVAPLHPGPPAARQGGEPARHGLRPRRDQPARGAGAARGLPAHDRGAARSSWRSSAARRRSAWTTAERRRDAEERLAASETAAGRARSPLGDRAPSSSIASCAIRSSCAAPPVEGTGSRSSRRPRLRTPQAGGDIAPTPMRAELLAELASCSAARGRCRASRR